MKQKIAIVTGAGGMIGSQQVKYLKQKGYWVRGVDLKYPEYSESLADEFIIGDLRDAAIAQKVLFSPLQKSLDDKENSFDECFHYAAQMGGAIYCFSGDYDAEIIHDSGLINLNVIHSAYLNSVKKILLASSACVYNEHKQDDPNNVGLKESDAWPAQPDSMYGREKLFMEQVADSYNRNYGLDIRVARFHNIFHEELTWKGDRPKAPAAICRKVAEANDGGEIEIFGDGEQTRSFMYGQETMEFLDLLMNSNYTKPVNVGSDELISINDLAYMVMDIAGKKLSLKHIDGPLGVRGRCSDNTLIEQVTGKKPSLKLRYGMERLYKWVNEQVQKDKSSK